MVDTPGACCLEVLTDVLFEQRVKGFLQTAEGEVEPVGHKAYFCVGSNDRRLRVALSLGHEADVAL